MTRSTRILLTVFLQKLSSTESFAPRMSVVCRPTKQSFPATLASRRLAEQDADDFSDYDSLYGNVESTDDKAGASDDDEILGFAIDSFLRGDYAGEFADSAPAPHPGLTPADVVESALRSLRSMDELEPSHGAAVLMRFCLPLTRGERWGGSESRPDAAWKQLLRGALTPPMLARRIRASEFAGLLDWTNIDVTEGAYGMERDLVGAPSLAFVNVAVYFGDGIEPLLFQFMLRRVGGVWLIDTVRKSPKELFVGRDGGDMRHAR